METLERTWETVGNVFGGALRGFERGVTSLFGSSNARYIKKLSAKLESIAALEAKFQALSDAELRHQTDLFRDRLHAGETLDDILVEAFAVVREGGRRFLGMRHYDVQMIGGMVLHSGTIAEMVTGEGKTLVATLPAYLNAIEGKGVHVVTVNDYLARRDMEWMAPLYMGLGLTVGAIQSDMPVLERQKAYACDITYGTNNEFGFDYLRDNMRPAARGDERYPKDLQQSQGKLHYAIIDEVDNILIDEARTPLIISGPAHADLSRYTEADRIARQLKVGEHFEVKEKEHTAHLTEEGVRTAEKLAGVESFYTAGNMEWPHLMENSLKAHFLYKRDVNYVVREGRVIIVDEFTGRLMDGRQWSDGLHQAVEAKEGVTIKKETQTLATITLQNFFKLYDKLCGMTGTAMTEANEFWKIYKLDVIAIPTNRGLRRIESPDVIYRTEREKYIAVAEDIERHHKWDVLVLSEEEEWWGTILSETEEEVVIELSQGKKKETVPKAKIRRIEYKGRPVLIGTTSIEKSERLSSLLEKRGVKHQVLNAKFHEREAEIVAQAGRLGAVTIATNMAGRGTDIVLGGNPETMAWAQLQHEYETRLDVPHAVWESLVHEIEKREKMKEQGAHVKSIGGLHVIGTERHESRRIDLQLRGRTGRQGDPGSSLFYLSLEDDLMRIFAGEWVKGILERLGMQEGEAIRSKMVTRRIEAAQKKVEERNFEMRKNLLEYDEVMDEQRKRVYRFRQNILDGYSCKDLVLDMIDEQSEHYITLFLARNYGPESFSAFAAAKLGMSRPFEARTFRGADFTEAERIARDEAQRNAESDIQEKLDENLPAEEDPSEWNWEAMARFSNTRWGSNFRDRDLKREGRDSLSDRLVEAADKFIQAVDLSEGEVFLKDDFGIRTAVAWVYDKFGIRLSLDDVSELEPGPLHSLVVERAREMYSDKRAQYPVMAALLRFTSPGGGGAPRLDRDALIKWASARFDTQLDQEDLPNMQREEITALQVERSRAFQARGETHRDTVTNRLNADLGSAEDDSFVIDCFEGTSKLESLIAWLNEQLHDNLEAEAVGRRTVAELRNHVTLQLDERYRPEMRRMERAVLLQLVDTAWKDHLLAMDHLRSSIGLVGYAQLDAKVEYKREGMKLFEEMWEAVGARVTDLIFRMEQLNEDFVESTWVETEARHEQAPPSSQIARDQQEAIRSSQGNPEEKAEPIRNADEKVGRNDPCPCGSGKKYKQCCSKRNKGAA